MLTLEETYRREAVRCAAPEMRTVQVTLQDLQWRTSQSGDGTRIISGYAALCGVRTVLYDGTYYRWTEMLAPGCFDRVLATNPAVHFDHGHDLKTAMAYTLAPGPVGKLQLTADQIGLNIYARLNPADPDVIALAAKMDLGIIDQASFMFRVLASGVETVTSYDDAGKCTEDDTITEVAELSDTCVCAQGAYPTTSLALRTNLRSGAHVPNREVPATDAGAAAQPVASQTDGAPLAVARSLAALRANALVAVHLYPATKEQA